MRSNLARHMVLLLCLILSGHDFVNLQFHFIPFILFYFIFGGVVVVEADEISVYLLALFLKIM